MLPFAAEHDLEMRHRIAVLHPAHAIEAEIADMMLAAGIEAAADLDVQAADRSRPFRRRARAAACASSAARPREEEIPSLQVSVPGQDTTSTIVPAPASAKSAAFRSLYSAGRSASLTQRRTMFCSTVVRMRFPRVLARDIGERAQLVRRDVAERQADGHGRIARLPLPVDIRVVPLLKLGIGGRS